MAGNEIHSQEEMDACVWVHAEDQWLSDECWEGHGCSGVLLDSDGCSLVRMVLSLFLDTVISCNHAL